MSPAKMLVAKVVSHRDLERETILALEEFAQFEFIDVRHQAHAVEVKRSREEELVFVAHDRLSTIIESLGLEPKRGLGARVEVDDSVLKSSLDHVSKVLDAVEKEVIEIDQNTASASLELERQKGTRDIALSLKPLGLDLSMIGETEYTFTTAGIIDSGRVSRLEWSLSELTEGAFVLKTIQLKRGVSVASVNVPVEMMDAVERVFSAIGLEAFKIPEGTDGRPEEIAKEAENKIAELETELEKLSSRKDSIIVEWGLQILAAYETLQIEKDRVTIKSLLVFTESSVKAWGWVPDGSQELLESLLKEKVGTAFDLKFDEPDFAEHDSPTCLDNPSIMKPTEDVVNAYGVPSKHDIDPTKVMFLSFPLIFGLVFADVGQGFLILLIGLGAWRAKRKGQDWGEIMGYLQNGAVGLMMMGLFAILGGFLFGSFFGSENVIEALWPIFAHTDSLGHPNPYRAAHMLKLSIEIGVIQIALGIFLALYNKMKHREYREAFIALFYLWVYIGFVNLLFGVSYNSIGEWFNPEGTVNLWLPIVGIGAGIGNNGVYPLLPMSPLIFTLIAFLVPFILMTLFSFKGGMDGVVHFLESAIGMISHTVSYARIFALNTVHVILSGVFFSLVPTPEFLVIPFPELSLFGVEIIPEYFIHEGHHIAPGLPLIGAIVGTFIVGILEGLLAFMHTLRLHFVEWFSKFYHAGGVAFAPFVAHRVHTLPKTAMLVEVSIPTN
ncbi:MAG: V-type ATP synthase subunit I [Candidatus Thorarchaeota archaeon]